MRFEQKWLGVNCSKDDKDLFPVSVPGNIQYDYSVYHDLGDVQYSDNVRKFEELENDHWEYVTSLSYEKKEGERVFFVAEGIQYKYHITLNGERICEGEGMYRPVELDMTERLMSVGNELRVHIYPHPKSDGSPAGTRDEADESCNPPVSYGWDWNPRLLISGIWQEAYVETRDRYFIASPEVTASLSEDLKLGEIEWNCQCDEECEIVLFDDKGVEVLGGVGNSGRGEITEPSLWWCNGQGEPTLYRWVIRNEKHSAEGYVGFRRIFLRRNTGATGPETFPKSRYEAPITIELNGRRIFAKGSNWVNPELFFGRITEERYDELLKLVKDGNMNILRVWGGSGICKEAFYSLCDRYGILVWQEFMLACNNYRGSEHYLSVLESEATAIVKKLRSHPSLALWCGGNELFNSWSGMDEQSLPLRLLNKLCYELDRDRPFIYTSPLFGMAHGGYSFYDGLQNGEVFKEFRLAKNTAYTEFGVPSVTAVEDLRKVIPEDELFPIKKTDSWLAHHGFEAWGEPRWLNINIHERYFGELTSLEVLIESSNWMQCEGYRGVFEEARRQWPYCSMAINWCYNEPWITAGGNNLITYPAKPKPAYEYVKAALRPTLFSAYIEKFLWRGGEEFSADLWLLNDSARAYGGTVKVSLELGDRCYPLLEWNGEAGENSNTRGPTVRMILPEADTDRLYLSLSSEDGTDSRYCFMYRPSEQKRKIKMMNM